MQANQKTKLANLGVSLLGCMGFAMFTTPANANAFVNLADGSSQVTLDPDTQAGVFQWEVSGVDHLEKEWWWLQVGGQRFSVDALSLSGLTTSANQATTTYTDLANGYTIAISYQLTGSDFASGQSLLKESVSIQNNSESPLDISLFMYSDFDLGNTPGDDTVNLFGLNDTDPFFGVTEGWFEASQTDAGNEHRVIFNGQPLLGEVDLWPTLLNKLNLSLDSLSEDASAVLPETVGATSLSALGELGPADVSYAIQWDFSIPAGGSDGAGVDKRLVVTPIPEPGTAALGLMALAALYRLRKRN